MQHLGDITKIIGAEIPVVDCIIGGSPCQDLSVAGKRDGLAGNRSGLFMDQIRIVKEMRENDRRIHSGRSDIIVPAHSSAVINTGVHVELPEGTVGMLKSKSGLNVKHGLVSEGVIDQGYGGAIAVKMYNHSCNDYFIRSGDKITQLVVMQCQFPEVEIVDEIESGERGDNGFGSTGR